MGVRRRGRRRQEGTVLGFLLSGETKPGPRAVTKKDPKALGLRMDWGLLWKFSWKRSF